MKKFISNPVTRVLNINYSRDNLFITSNSFIFLILSQSLITCNQYRVKPAEKITTCSVPWPLFLVSDVLLTVFSMEHEKAWVYNSQPWSQELLLNLAGIRIQQQLLLTKVVRSLPGEARQPAPSLLLGVRCGRTWEIPACTEGRPCIPERAGVCWGQSSLGAVIQVLRLHQEGGTTVEPEEAWVLVPDSSIGNAQVTHLNKWVFLTFL